MGNLNEGRLLIYTYMLTAGNLSHCRQRISSN
jgi:hypothetical protein